MKTKSIISALKTLDLSFWYEFIGENRWERLAELGIKHTKENLSELVFLEKGYDVFKNKELRSELLKTKSLSDIAEAYELSVDTIDRGKLSKKHWGNNTSSNNFLSLFSIPVEGFFNTKSKAEPYKSRTNINMVLFDYQNSVRLQLLEFLSKPQSKRVMVHMPTGSGKTRTAVELISDYIRNYNNLKMPNVVAWMAHNDELCEQAAEKFTEVWEKMGSEDVNIYRLWGSRKIEKIDSSKPAFLVTSFQTCHAAVKSSSNNKFVNISDFRAHCNLLIVDEAHKSTAPQFKKAINFLSNHKTKVVGLTATPGRHHKGSDAAPTEELAEYYDKKMISFGENITNGINEIQFLQSREILSEVNMDPLPNQRMIQLTKSEVYSAKENLEIPDDILRKLGDDSYRTLLIVKRTKKLVLEENKQTIIFCPTKQNACDLSIKLQTLGIKSRAITGDTAIDDRREWIDQYKSGSINVLTNFGVLTTGFDAPKTEAVIIARPTLSIVLYSQMVGRGLRGKAVGGTKRCTVVNVVDNIVNLPDIQQAFLHFNEYFGE